jgi:hypothetical protein
LIARSENTGRKGRKSCAKDAKKRNGIFFLFFAFLFESVLILVSILVFFASFAQLLRLLRPVFKAHL